MISEYLVMLREGKVIFYGKTAELLAQQQPVIVAKSKRATDLKKLLKIAKNSGHSASIIAGAVHVISDSSFAAKFNELAFDAGITLSSLNAVLPTLEETFFEMTGE
jgi:ABC-2 type transport system ATP-binding protein